MAKFLKGRIKKLESCRKPQNDNKRWSEKFRQQSLKALTEAMEREGIKPLPKEDYANNEEGVMDLNRLLKIIRRLKKDDGKKS